MQLCSSSCRTTPQLNGTASCRRKLTRHTFVPSNCINFCVVYSPHSYLYDASSKGLKSSHSYEGYSPTALGGFQTLSLVPVQTVPVGQCGRSTTTHLRDIPYIMS